MAEYGFLDRILHRITLQATPVAELSFQIDQMASGADAASVTQGRHVFVSGLARAGTTILMRRIHASGEFCSLTYRNMPAVLAPNLWGRISGARRKEPPAERAHGDRILVDLDSPESLDEVFWRVFDGESYIGDSFLTQHRPDGKVTEKYAAYVAAILKADSKGRSRYLSKNNNNILRLGAIRRQFPEAVILIPFREPLSHAGSLHRQHLNFIARQTEDPFVRSYMTWLGHHEFGLDHRPFQFDRAGREQLSAFDPGTPDYWLELWCQVYAWIERTAPEDAVFVCYEDLCKDPSVWPQLAGICGIAEGETGAEAFSMAAPKTGAGQPSELETRASALYGRLVERARAALRAAGDP